jgi:hypothetical protein
VLTLLIRRYLFSCGLLLLPILAWNFVLIGRLPVAISSAELWNAIPRPLALAENVLRVFVFAVPFFMPLQASTSRQKRGVALFIVGVLVYFASWLPLIAAPQSAWAHSAAGFLAPAYTPVLWLLALGQIGEKLSWGNGYRPWMYAVLSMLFLAVHLAHATVVYVHNY